MEEALEKLHQVAVVSRVSKMFDNLFVIWFLLIYIFQLEETENKKLISRIVQNNEEMEDQV
jgi:hypothetical protein